MGHTVRILTSCNAASGYSAQKLITSGLLYTKIFRFSTRPLVMHMDEFCPAPPFIG